MDSFSNRKISGFQYGLIAIPIMILFQLSGFVINMSILHMGVNLGDFSGPLFISIIFFGLFIILMVLTVRRIIFIKWNALICLPMIIPSFLSLMKAILISNNFVINENLRSYFYWSWTVCNVYAIFLVIVLSFKHFKEI